MASDYIQDLAFRQISHAIMATANSVGSAAAGNDGNSGESSIFGVMRRKWGKVQDVIQGIAAPLKRRSMYDELPEHVWPSEHIEMSQIPQRGLGHNFIPCNLTNPTWCDYCGDFIWGVYKQCLRCQTCQYTCHQHCVPAVTLNCKSISDDGVEVTVPKTPTPTDARSQLETSLSLGNISARPGCARNVTISSPAPTELSAVSAQHPSDYSPQGGGYSSHVTRPGAGSNLYVGVYHGQSGPSSSSNLTLSANTLPRSVSEGYVTAHSSPQQGPIVTTPHNSQGFSSPYSSPQSAHINRGSNPATLQRPNIQSSPLSPGSGCGDKVGFSDQVTQENSSISPDIISSSPSEAEGPLTQHTLITDRENNLDEANEKDETDSGYRSGTIPDDKLPRVPSQETLDRQELKRKIAKFNHFVPAATLELTDKESFQGFVKVTMNLIRPITMELGARPPSIYELLTREHIIEENTQQVAFYMPRDTHKSLHITSETTTKEVITSLLKKFHILDHPRKFAMYEQEFSDRNKLVRLRRLTDKDFPLRAILTWNPERIKNYRMVLQENETGEIVWDAFSLPELGNFLKVLDREEKETILELKHKYAYMKQYMERRLTELRNERNKQGKSQK